MLLILETKKGVERLLQFLLSPQQLLCPWWQPDQQGNHEIKCLSFCGFSIFKMAHISWPWLKINYNLTHLPRTSPCLWSPMPTFVNWSLAWGNVLDHETATPHHFKRETVAFIEHGDLRKMPILLQRGWRHVKMRPSYPVIRLCLCC